LIRSAPDSPPPGSGAIARIRPQLLLIGANLVPLVGVVFLGWDLLSVLLLYWLETLLICILAVLRVLRQSGVRALGSVLVFLAVFLCLGAAHMAGLLVLAGALGEAGTAIPDLSAVADAPLFAALQTLYFGGLEWIARDRPALLQYGLPALVACQIAGLWPGAKQAVDRAPVPDQAILRQALVRVITLHLALLFGSAVIAALLMEVLLPVLVLLVLLKLLFDLRAQNWSRQERDFLQGA
jgi:hypothetical protein